MCTDSVNCTQNDKFMSLVRLSQHGTTLSGGYQTVMEDNHSKKFTNKELFESQKEMLLTFAKTGAISKEYCDREIKILTEKMDLNK